MRTIPTDGRSTTALFLLCALLLSVAPAGAQPTTGNISGTVTAEDGGPLPGATVTLEGPGFLGSRVETTDARGEFRFRDVAPGPVSIYTELDGFSTERREVTIEAGRTATLDVTLSLAAMAEGIVVTGVGASISEATAGAASYTADEIEKLPITREAENIAQLAPGVRDDGNEELADERPWKVDLENLWMLNGVVIHENVRGQQLPLFIEDEIQETTTQVAGVAAQYATVTANFVTEIGSQEWSGQGRYVFFGQGIVLPPDGAGGAELRIGIGEREDGTACFDGFGFFDPDGTLVPFPGPLEPGEGVGVLLDSPLLLNTDPSRGDYGSPFLEFSPCGGRGPSLLGIDLDTPTHLFVGGAGVQTVDLPALLRTVPKNEETHYLDRKNGGPVHESRIEGSYFFETGNLKHEILFGGGLRDAVPYDPASLIPSPTDEPLDGFGLLGMDPNLLAGGWEAATTGSVDIDGDGSGDSYFIKISDLQNPCPGVYAGFFTVDRTGDGGGTLKPDPAAEGLDCDSLAPLFEDDSWQPGDRWSFEVRAGYADPRSSAVLDFRYGGASPEAGTGDEVLDLRLEPDQQFTDNLTGILSLDAFNATDVRNRRWIHGGYWIQDPDDDLEDLETPDRTFTDPLTPGLFTGGGHSAFDHTLGSVAAAPVDGSIQDVGVEFGTGIDEKILFHGDDRYAPGGALVEDDVPPILYFVAQGGSTGEVFDLEIVHPAGGTAPLRGILAIEPVAATGADRARFEAELAALGGVREKVTASAYCLQYAADAPPAGTVFRVAGRQKQAAFAPQARALAAARRLHEAGLLNPDTSPEGYFHSIRQWSVWTMGQGFDADGFVDAFLEHTRKNVEAGGREWTDEIAGIARTSAERRWGDISRVLEEASR